MKNSDNAHAYGDTSLWVAARGTTAPTDPTSAWGLGWSEAGWLSDDGFKESRDMKAEEKRANGGHLVRVLKTQDSRKFSVQCLEENAVTLGLERPGSTVTTTAGITRTSVKANLARDIRAFGLDMVDGAVSVRKVIPLGEVTGGGDIVYKDSEITVRQYEITCYPDANKVLYEEYRNDPAAAVA